MQWQNETHPVKSELKLQNQVLGKFGKLPQDAEERKKELKMMRETAINGAPN